MFAKPLKSMACFPHCCGDAMICKKGRRAFATPAMAEVRRVRDTSPPSRPGSTMPAARPATRPLLLLALTALTTLVAACGGGGGGSGDSAGGGTGGGTDSLCGETARKQWVLNVAREWYLFPDLLPAAVDIGVLRDRGRTARCTDRDGPRAGQGSLLQLPDDEVRRELAPRRRPVRRLRLPLTHRHRQPSLHPRRVRRQPGGGSGTAARRRGRSPSTRAAVSSLFRNRLRMAPPRSPTCLEPLTPASSVACDCCATDRPSTCS